VLHLVNTRVHLGAVRDAERRLAEQRERLDRQRQLLERILGSRTSGSCGCFTGIRGSPRAEIRGVLDGPGRP
jgi:hypothetical protein